MDLTRTTPRWTRHGWVRLNNGSYRHPDFGLVAYDTVSWRATVFGGRHILWRNTRDQAMQAAKELAEGRRRSA